MKVTKKQKIWIRRLVWVLFLIYLAAMAYFLFFSEQLNRTSGDFTPNYILFKEIRRSFWCYQNGRQSYFYLNVVMNVVAFMPFGFILPIISPKNRGILPITLLGFEMTLLIELLQKFLNVGSFDVDDMLLNTVGAVLGYLLFKICLRLDSSGRHRK